MRRLERICRPALFAFGGLIPLVSLASLAQAQPPNSWGGWSLERPHAALVPSALSSNFSGSARGLDFGVADPTSSLPLYPQGGWAPNFPSGPQLGLNFGRGSGFAEARVVSGLPSTGTMLITGPSAGRGEISIDLTPSLASSGALAGAQAITSLSVPDGHGGTVHIDQKSFSPAVAGNRIETYAFSPGAGGGAYAALSLDGATGQATALAAVFDPGGFSVIGLGAPESARVETRLSSHSQVRQLGVVIASPLARSRDWSWGPRYGFGDLSRSVGETLTTSATLAGSRVIPGIESTRRTRIEERSRSLTLGLGGQRLISDDLSFGLYLDLGARGISVRGRSAESLSIPGVASVTGSPDRTRFSDLEPILRAGVVFEQRLDRSSAFALSFGVQETGQSTLVTRFSGSVALGAGSSSGATLSSSGETVRHDELRWRHGYEGLISLNFVHVF